jgi:DNA/RNA endonuclease YhcR with UshA esterase domain
VRAGFRVSAWVGQQVIRVPAVAASGCAREVSVSGETHVQGVSSCYQGTYTVRVMQYLILVALELAV